MMKNINKTTVLIAFSFLVIGILLGLLFFGNSNSNQAEKHTSSIESESTEVWTCSMHPKVRKNEPGDCPICGMELIPLDSEDAAISADAVQMSPTAMQLAQVQTVVVGTDKAEKAIRLTGKVQPDERLLFTQSSHIPGRVEKLTVNFTGDFVSEGQVIAHIYSPDLVTAQRELLEAEKIKESQPSLFKAAREKLKNWKLTDRQVEQIVETGNTVEAFPILANASGYVTKKLVNVGDYLKQGEAIYEIADLSRVWVLFDIYESNLAWIEKGNKVTYTVQSLPGNTFNGTISYVDPVIDPKTRVAKARVEAANPNLKLKPEMFVTGRVEAERERESTSLAVPKSAVMWTGKRSVVYVMEKSEHVVSFAMREVILGPELGESYVIESGLQAGEEIAVNGTFSIDAAAQLAGKPSMMNPEGSVTSSAHNHGENLAGKDSNTSVNASRFEVSADDKQALQPVFDNYFEMKTALVNDNFKKAKEAGVEINKAVNRIDENTFDKGARTLWMEHSNSLKKSTRLIHEQGDIETLRETFIPISNAMIAIAEAFGPISSPIYVQHCPMADSNQGADWLSQINEIRNPYFGSAMLTCGETTKQIRK